MDGTLVDDMRFHTEARGKMLAENGIEMNARDFLVKTAGKRKRFSANFFRPNANLSKAENLISGGRKFIIESIMSEIIKCAKCGANNRVNEAAEKSAVCGKCKSPLIKNTKPLHLTDANFSTEVDNSPLPVLVDFWAAWCGPCRLIAPVIEQLAAELAGKCAVGKLDVDQNQRTAARFGVQSIPTLLILKNGKEIERLVGAQSKEAILSRLQKHL